MSQLVFYLHFIMQLNNIFCLMLNHIYILSSMGRIKDNLHYIKQYFHHTNNKNSDLNSLDSNFNILYIEKFHLLQKSILSNTLQDIQINIYFSKKNNLLNMSYIQRDFDMRYIPLYILYTYRDIHKIPLDIHLSKSYLMNIKSNSKCKISILRLSLYMSNKEIDKINKIGLQNLQLICLLDISSVNSI